MSLRDRPTKAADRIEHVIFGRSEFDRQAMERELRKLQERST